MEKELSEGTCVGGPMNGKEGQSRFPKGFILVDKAAQKAWKYVWTDIDGATGFKLDWERELSIEGRLLAADGPDYDVRAWPL